MTAIWYLAGTLASQAALVVRLASRWRPGRLEGWAALAVLPFYAGLGLVCWACWDGFTLLGLASWCILTFALTPAVAAGVVSWRTGLDWDYCNARLRGRPVPPPKRRPPLLVSRWVRLSLRALMVASAGWFVAALALGSRAPDWLLAAGTVTVGALLVSAIALDWRQRRSRP